MYEAPLYPNTLSKTYLSASSYAGSALLCDEFSSSKVYGEALSSQLNSGTPTGSLWSRQPCEQFGVATKANSLEGEGVKNRESDITQEPVVEFSTKLLQSFRICIERILKLEVSDWLFRKIDGTDEDVIDRVAARERFFDEAETREMTCAGHMGESHVSADRKPVYAQKNEELVTPVLHCGENCTCRKDLITSFGIWCIHRALELSLMESRPELWGKYTYVLNHLQGIIDLAFSKPRSLMTPCFCLQLPKMQEQRSSLPMSYGGLPPPAKQDKGKCTTAAMLLDMVEDVEIAIQYRKGRPGTASGDVGFPIGKENLASVVKRYKRRLSNKPSVTNEDGPSSPKLSLLLPYGT